MFLDPHLSSSSKRHLYGVRVLSVLLYGSECWCPLREDLEALERFHLRSIRLVLGISRQDQHLQHLTSAQLRVLWGDPDTISMHIERRRLQWLGHVARMPASRIPKQVLFGFMNKSRPFCGPRRRWKDVVSADLKRYGVSDWYCAAQDRAVWRTLINTPPADVQHVKRVVCTECQRTFRRESDLKRHKCLIERSKPVQQQQGSVQCRTCERWFHSKGGLAVHRCCPDTPGPSCVAQPPVVDPASGLYHCQTCGRSCKSQAGFYRHNCHRGNRAAKQDRVLYKYECKNCSRPFRRPQDLSRHSRYCP